MTTSRRRARWLALALALLVTVNVGCADTTGPSNTEAGIVYSFRLGGQPLHDLYLIREDGTANRPFMTGGDRLSPSWSPDGRTFIFYYIDGMSEGRSWLANADGTNQRPAPGTNGALARWSADGSWLVFADDWTDPGVGVIDAIRPDGNGRHTLTAGVSDVVARHRPSWSRTGRIAFVRDVNRIGFGAGNIWTVNADGTGLTQLTSGVRDQSPLWSPDGSMLAFDRIDPTQSTTQIALVNADGSGRRLLGGVDETLNNYIDDWSPDGRWLLFHSVGQLYSQYGCAYFKIAVAGGAPIPVSPWQPGAAGQASCGGASWRSVR